MSRDEDFVDIEGDDEELSYINRDTSVEKMEEDSLAQDLQITPENSDDESIGSWAYFTKIRVFLCQWIAFYPYHNSENTNNFVL